jgi:hypothetical protein
MEKSQILDEGVYDDLCKLRGVDKEKGIFSAYRFSEGGRYGYIFSKRIRNNK